MTTTIQNSSASYVFHVCKRYGFDTTVDVLCDALCLTKEMTQIMKSSYVNLQMLYTAEEMILSILELKCDEAVEHRTLMDIGFTVQGALLWQSFIDDYGYTLKQLIRLIFNIIPTGVHVDH